MNPYQAYVESVRDATHAARSIKPQRQQLPIAESAARCLIFAPHPDDECIIGGLPLRLMREAGYQVVNVPVTFGSNPDRQAARSSELDDACAYLGWAIDREPAGVEAMDADGIAAVIRRWQPQVIVFPHDGDWNVRHISTHHMVVEGLQQLGDDFDCLTVESEFWGAMDDPNLIVALDATMVADLVAATALHVEEVARNPYHLMLPAWMQDNVRRGGELVGGQGTAAPDFDFATLYRLRRWTNGAFAPVLDGGTQIGLGSDALRKLGLGSQ
ncbi:MAG: LmbE family N-acetylglucosaminyl deacetylase [Rhodothermales bacterium]|jgi:LmbE family N-acetylglucosaminyl deacetylase